MGSLSFKYRPLFLSGGALIVLVVLALLTGNFLLNRISDLRKNIETTKVEVTKLESRLAVLQEADNEPENLPQIVVEALPSKSPAFLVISQIRSLASELGLIVNSLELAPQNIEGLEVSQVQVTFTVEGEYGPISEFVTQLGGLKPLLNLTSVKMQTINNTTQADMSLLAFWAPFPQELPPIDQPIVGLLDSEKEILESLSEFKSPEIGTELVPQEPVESRADPFFLEF